MVMALLGGNLRQKANASGRSRLQLVFISASAEQVVVEAYGADRNLSRAALALWQPYQAHASGRQWRAEPPGWHHRALPRPFARTSPLVGSNQTLISSSSPHSLSGSAGHSWLRCRCLSVVGARLPMPTMKERCALCHGLTRLISSVQNETGERSGLP